MNEPDLAHHGDLELGPGLLDLAINVRAAEPPAWLRGRLVRALDRLGSYPDPTAATEAVARRHGRSPEEVLLVSGAAEAFVLVARAVVAKHVLCVHPSFTEPELAMRHAGHDVQRLILESPYDLTRVPEAADLVVVGNPTNPTGVLHPDLDRLCRDGRITVVDEAFMDAVPDEPESLAGRSDLPGLIVVRSLTKTWALAGLRVGYLLAAPDLVAALRRTQPLWAVSTLGLVALEACLAPGPVAQAQRQAEELAEERVRLAAQLGDVGVEVCAPSSAPFLLCRIPGRPDVREALRARGIAVRRGETFPGLGPEHWRTAVRDAASSTSLIVALRDILADPSLAR
ncbi:MAG: Rv2231c family pyridoxal phosphate-dependent protein CobC [Mycobacteriales bacterium]